MADFNINEIKKITLEYAEKRTGEFTIERLKTAIISAAQKGERSVSIVVPVEAIREAAKDYIELNGFIAYTYMDKLFVFW